MGGFLPGLEQGLLVRAALLDDDAAGRAWMMWREVRGARGLQNTEPATHHLLPMVAWRLDRLAHDGWQAARLRGVHKKSYARNALLWHRVRPAIARLVEAGVTPMWVGGSGLARRLYPDWGARHLDRFDLMVRPEALGQAVAAIGADGTWQPGARDPLRRARTHELQSWHASGDGGATGLELVVRTRLTPWSPTPEAVWGRAEPFTVDGLAGVAPAPLDAIVAAAVDGLQWHEHALCEWVLDLGLAFQRWQPDEGAILEAAKATRTTRLMHLALKELPGIGVPVSWDLIWNLDHAPRAAEEDRWARARTESPALELGTLWKTWRYLERGKGPIGFASYLRDRLELDDWRAVRAFTSSLVK